jgi:hypothetical protein
MNDLERRLRSGLGALADAVPPSEDAWAEQQRRIGPARRTVRRPLLAAAAAAVVAGTVVTGSVLARQADQPAGPIDVPLTTGPVDPSRLPSSTLPNASADRGPFDLGVFTAGSTRWRASTFVDLSGQAPQVCVTITQLMSADPAPDGPAADYPPQCAPMRADEKVESRAVSAASAPPIGPMPGRLLFLAVPQVATLTVCAGDGTPATVTELTRTEALVLYVADFGAATSEGFCFTALDAGGAVVAAGIS